jgi:hypothetical protein
MDKDLQYIFYTISNTLYKEGSLKWRYICCRMTIVYIEADTQKEFDTWLERLQRSIEHAEFWNKDTQDQQEEVEDTEDIKYDENGRWMT